MAKTRIVVNGYRGDSAGFALEVLRGGQPVDFSEAIVRAEIRTQPDGELLGEWGVSIEGSRLAFSLLPKETELLPATARFDVEVDWAGDRTQVETVAIGVLNTPADVTLAPAVA